MIPAYPNTGRFTRRLKGDILAAIASGELPIPEAIVRYNLSSRELDRWTTSMAAYGIAGLSACFQHFRRKSEIGRVYRWFRQPDGSLERRPERHVGSCMVRHEAQDGLIG
jgi:hypothetical protein